MRGLPKTKDIHDAYSHGCNSFSLLVWIERRGSITSPPSSLLSPPPLLPSSPCVGVITTMPAGRERGVDGTCARRSAAIPERPIILRDRGLTADQMPVAQPLARLSSGVTTSARSSATRTVNGSYRAATMAMRFGPALDHWPVPSLSGTHTERSERSHPAQPKSAPADRTSEPAHLSRPTPTSALAIRAGAAQRQPFSNQSATLTPSP
jgi:hypothetical protein